MQTALMTRVETENLPSEFAHLSLPPPNIGNAAWTRKTEKEGEGMEGEEESEGGERLVEEAESARGGTGIVG